MSALPYFERLDEIVRLVERFEHGSLPRNEWNHAAHLTVTLWYMLHLDEPTAAATVIDGIRAYNRTNGIRQTRNGGYHETITLFWLAVTRNYAKRLPAEAGVLDAVNGFVARYVDRPGLFLKYFTRECVFSRLARQTWVEPDLRPLDELDSDVED